MKESEPKKPAYEVVFDLFSEIISSVHGTHMMPGHAGTDIDLLEKILTTSEIPEDYKQHISEVSDSLIRSAHSNSASLERELVASINRVKQSLSLPTD